MRTRNMIALGLLAVFYIGFGLILTLQQERVIYQPGNQDFAACPALAGSNKIEHNGTRMYAGGPADAPVAVLYHGNAGSACDRAFYANYFTQAGYQYRLVEYAGYSNDPRAPTHDRIKQDVRNVIAHLKHTGVPNVAIVGESIGTGVAAHHASLAPPNKLLLVAPFTSLADVARHRFWFYPTGWLVDNAFDTAPILEDYAGPVTIIHGTNDTIIPFAQGQTLAERRSASTTFVAVNGAGHNDIFSFAEYRAALERFLDQP